MPGSARIMPALVVDLFLFGVHLDMLPEYIRLVPACIQPTRSVTRSTHGTTLCLQSSNSIPETRGHQPVKMCNSATLQLCKSTNLPEPGSASLPEFRTLQIVIRSPQKLQTLRLYYQKWNSECNALCRIYPGMNREETWLEVCRSVGWLVGGRAPGTPASSLHPCPARCYGASSTRPCSLTAPRTVLCCIVRCSIPDTGANYG